MNHCKCTEVHQNLKLKCICIKLEAEGLTSKYGFHDGDLIIEQIDNIPELQYLKTKNPASLEIINYLVITKHLLTEIHTPCSIEFNGGLHNQIRIKEYNNQEIDLRRDVIRVNAYPDLAYYTYITTQDIQEAAKELMKLQHVPFQYLISWLLRTAKEMCPQHDFNYN